ncbi:MAG: glycosyltransferase family 2 protein [Desulfobacterales bacterium]
MKHASVSVIIPCFNSQDTIARAVGSVMNQTSMPLEIILVNDGSHDSTPALLVELQHRHGDIIKVIHLDKNHGPSRTRNLAWEAASGDFIAFLDSDDSWHPRKIEIQYSWMIDHPEVVLTGHSCVQASDQQSAETVTGKWRARRAVAWKFLLSNYFSTPSVMIKRDLPYRFNDEKRHSEDYLLWLEIVLNGLHAWSLNLPLAYIHKAPFGEKGLSGNLWNMEKGELDTFRRLHQKGLLPFTAYFSLIFFSLLKHGVRVAKLHLFPYQFKTNIS